MRKKFGEGAGSICRAYFKRNFMRRKSERRAELSCHTWFSRMDGLLSPAGMDWHRPQNRRSGNRDYGFSNCRFWGGGTGYRGIAQEYGIRGA